MISFYTLTFFLAGKVQLFMHLVNDLRWMCHWGLTEDFSMPTSNPTSLVWKKCPYSKPPFMGPWIFSRWTLLCQNNIWKPIHVKTVWSLIRSTQVLYIVSCQMERWINFGVHICFRFFVLSCRRMQWISTPDLVFAKSLTGKRPNQTTSCLRHSGFHPMRRLFSMMEWNHFSYLTRNMLRIMKILDLTHGR